VPSDILTARIESPLGPLVAAATRDGICMLEFSGLKRLPAQLASLRRRFRAAAVSGRNKHIDRLERQLAEYFAGRRRRFDLPLITPGTSFQRRVWKELARIPYGETRTYGDLARRLRVPSAPRAVGRANGSNPVSILLPCHRLIGSGGDLTGYGGGLWRKRRLLELERGALALPHRETPMRRRTAENRGSERSSSKAESTPR
jgi:AraC family transcriptional regulator of adaptative response/methylated-DNA-[protein]-cysteine methyltransferase